MNANSSSAATSADTVVAHRAITSWTWATLRLLPKDAASFGAGVRIRSEAVFTQHRDGLGRILGWETVAPGPGGKPVIRYSKGCARGLVLEERRPAARRLLLVEGAVAVLAARALAAGEASELRYCGLGGVWNADAASHVATLVQRTGLAGVILANGTHHPAGRILREQALASLATLKIPVVERDAPPAGWTAALRETRMAAIVQ